MLIQHYAMLQRNLLYTGITRGKRLVVLVGQKKAVAIAVRNISGRRRWSKLQEGWGLGNSCNAYLASIEVHNRETAARCHLRQYKKMAPDHLQAPFPLVR